ncbi:TetR family transcriptional regulator [Roseomonas elaeocarpi]|uniref:TetR family transcriptional regulator n=1 Tax=Roseomonas elaeocarpi TaxID=907779 RepID=A0ABV6JV11_9PROT
MTDKTDADPAFLDASAGTAVLDALWRVVAERGWHGVTFRLIAEESGQPLDALRTRYPTPHALLAAHARAVDAAVLTGTMANQGGTARDRIFDLLMRRFDALAPHREGIVRFQRDLRQHPMLALSLSPMLMASMAWMLEGAEVDTSGLKGAMRVQGLAGVWIAASRAWADDTTVDLGPTMAALDRALDRAEQVARTLRLDDGDLGTAPAMDEPLADPFDAPPEDGPLSGGPLAGGPAGGASAVPPSGPSSSPSETEPPIIPINPVDPKHGQ